MKSELFGVELPLSLRGEDQQTRARAMAFAAGYLLYVRGNQIAKVPKALQPLCSDYKQREEASLNAEGDITSFVDRTTLLYPDVTREESSFWAGYLSGESSLRDRVRSASLERHTPDSVDSMSTFRGDRNLAKELWEMFHTDYR